MARLEVEDLCKNWDRPLIDHLSFAVEEGEIFAVVGRSGVGKTTLLRLIAGLETPDRGRILIGGRDVTGLPAYERRVAMTFASCVLYPHMTVYENIASPLRGRRRGEDEIDARVRSVARLLRIGDLLQARPGEIAEAHKRLIAFGRALVAEPGAFLFDEPLGGLDARSRHELRMQLHGLKDLRRAATLYATLDDAEALSLADRIGVMSVGGFVQVGAPRELFERPANLFVAERLGQPAINVVPAEFVVENGAVAVRARGARLTLRIPNTSAAWLKSRREPGVTLGLRPQHVRPAAEGAKGVRVWGRVEAHEALAPAGVLIAEVQGVRLTALTSHERSFERGAPIELAVDTGALFYFDPTTGVNLLSRR